MIMLGEILTRSTYGSHNYSHYMKSKGTSITYFFNLVQRDCQIFEQTTKLIGNLISIQSQWSMKVPCNVVNCQKVAASPAKKHLLLQGNQGTKKKKGRRWRIKMGDKVCVCGGGGGGGRTLKS